MMKSIRRNLLNKFIVFLLLIALCVPMSSFADDETPVGKISIDLHSIQDNSPIQEAELEMYKIADYSGENIEIVPELVGYITSDDIIDNAQHCADVVDDALQDTGLTPVMAAISDATGHAVFNNVPDAVYYIRLKQNNETDAKYSRRIEMTSIIAPMPALNDDGTFERQYLCKPKCNVFETVDVSVVKRWKDGNHEDDRPDSISVSLYKDGSLVETVSFSAEDGWKYSWTQLPAGDYTVKENDVPSIYRSTVVEEPDNVFSITNVYYDPEVPRTGDDMNLLFWGAIFGSAIVLSTAFIIVFFGKKNRKREPEDVE